MSVIIEHKDGRTLRVKNAVLIAGSAALNDKGVVLADFKDDTKSIVLEGEIEEVKVVKATKTTDA